MTPMQGLSVPRSHLHQWRQVCKEWFCSYIQERSELSACVCVHLIIVACICTYRIPGLCDCCAPKVNFRAGLVVLVFRVERKVTEMRSVHSCWWSFPERHLQPFGSH